MAGVREELSPAQIRGKRPHIPQSPSQGDLPDYTGTEKLLGGQKGRECHFNANDANYPQASSLEPILAKRCAPVHGGNSFLHS